VKEKALAFLQPFGLHCYSHMKGTQFMSRKARCGALSFLKNLAFHGRCILTGKEALSHALPAIWEDLRKVGHAAIASSEKARNHRRSAKLTEAGRKSYNAGAYAKAEEFLRRAISTDPKYALPVAYLGNTLYKQGEFEQAVAVWKRAYNLDPSSEGGTKAWRKLRALRNQGGELVSELEMRVMDTTVPPQGSSDR